VFRLLLLNKACPVKPGSGQIVPGNMIAALEIFNSKEKVKEKGSD
jgi:hypothetical protein